MHGPSIKFDEFERREKKTVGVVKQNINLQITTTKWKKKQNEKRKNTMFFLVFEKFCIGLDENFRTSISYANHAHDHKPLTFEANSKVHNGISISGRKFRNSFINVKCTSACTTEPWTLNIFIGWELCGFWFSIRPHKTLIIDDGWLTLYLCSVYIVQFATFRHKKWWFR